MPNNQGVVQWFSRFRLGLRMSSGWFWFVLTVTLNVFTTATILLVVVDDSGTGFKVVGSLAAVSLLVLIGMVLLQAPYRGQLAETARTESELQEVKKELEKLESEFKPALATKIAQYDAPGVYIWALLNSPDLAGVGTHKGQSSYLIVRLTLISCLIEPLPFQKLEGELRLNGESFGWVEFRTSSRQLPRFGQWAASEKQELTDAQIRRIEEIKESHPEITFDIVIWAEKGNEIRLQQLQPNSLRNGG